MKAHIKREFVDLTEVPRYFESLKAANKSNDFKLSSIAFSTICHLIKRVGMQDPHMLRGVSKIILPILVNRLLDQKPNFRSQAKSSLETFWLATPSIVENYLKDSALIHSNQHIRSESIIFISDLIDLSKSFNFHQFLPNLVNLLRDDSIEVLKNTEVLLIKYYTLNKSKTQDLVHEFKVQKIDSKTATKVLKEVDLVAANQYASETRSTDTSSRSTIDSFNNLARFKGTKPAVTNKTKGKLLTTNKELANILEKITTAKLDESIQPKVISSAQDLSREVESLLPPFNGKETEFNWGNREKNINKFRSIIAGNSEKYPDALLQSVRALSEGISKSVCSLRTTLSSSGCHLIKELAAYLGKHLDPVSEQMFHPLASMTSATKKITSMNAFGSLCVLLVNTSYSNRIFNQCFTLYQDKNIQPRLYSSTFLQIFILKHGAKLDQQSLETIQKWASKGVSDPNITVRESMRTTFWILYRRFPHIASTIFSKQDMNVKKALERSKPKDITESLSAPSSRPTAAANERTRPSVREFVASKQRERRSISDPSASNVHSREPSEPPQDNNTADMGKPNRIGVPQRVRVPSAGSSYMLPRQLSKGSRSTSLSSHLKTDNKELDRSTASVMKPDNEQRSTDDDNINEMKRQLNSSLTREKINGIQLLKEHLINGRKITGLSSIINKLIILDSILLKPLLRIPEFYELVDVASLVKVLAVNKEDINILLQKFEKLEIIKGINAVIKSFDDPRFGNGASTMFHIKHKNCFLDFSVIHLYEILASEDFKATDEILQEICQTVFPLSFSDYPRYDELVVQLFELNGELCEKTLASSNAFTKSKIHMILEDFKEPNEEKEKQDATEYGLAEMTMINPLNKRPTDPTTSIKAGFGTDMTMILPNFKVSSQKENIDEDADMKDVNEKGKDYIRDIFNNEHQNGIQQDEQLIKRESVDLTEDRIKEVMKSNNDENHDNNHTGEIEMEIEEENDKEPHDEDGDVEVTSEANVASPFLDNPNEDDIIDTKIKHDNTPQLKPADPSEEDSDCDDRNVHSDEMTRNLTDKISGIHISPQKPMFTSGCESMSKLADQIDPFFSNMKKHIKIFEDRQPVAEVHEQKLTDLEMSHIGKMNQDEENGNTDELIEVVSNLTEKFSHDQIGAEEMNKTIKSLHRVVNREDVLSWMKTTGFKPMLLSVIKYFNTSANITKQLCFKGMIVFKELMILNSLSENIISLTEAVAIWNILVMIVENLKNFKNELYISADELVDEILDLDITNLKSTIRKSCFSTLKEGESNSTPLVSFLMLTIIKCIEHECLSLDQINKIDEVIFRYLSSDEVEIRRLTIITYSKCKNKLELIDTNTNQKNINGKLKHESDNVVGKEADLTTEFFGKLSMSQKKLVDYYCNA